MGAVRASSNNERSKEAIFYECNNESQPIEIITFSAIHAIDIDDS